MAEPEPLEPRAARRERWLAATIVVALVIARSAVLVFWEQAHFDGDQAIVGLMAKHLAEGRAWPLFYYGQNYMLGVQAWLAAPVFLVAGASVTALKLPLLAIHVLVALLLLRIFERDVGLRPALAAVPALFIAVPAPATTALLLTANGGSVEPYAYALLLWLTRHRPNWGGLILGVGFLQREFTLYALLALLAVEAFRRTLFTREGILRRVTMLRTAAEVWLVVQWLKYFASAAGPGTTLENVHRPARDNIASLADRMCVDLQTLPSGLWALVRDHWPILFGTRHQPLAELGVDSTVWQGFPLSWVALAIAIVVAAGGVAMRIASERTWRAEYDACVYLVLVGVFSCLGYVIGRCGELDIPRYELLSPLGAAGLGAWFVRSTPPRAALRTWIAVVCAWTMIPAAAHGRLLAEYLTRPPTNTRRVIVTQLEMRGIKYALAEYWTAYSTTFLANERVIVASEDFVRISEYQDVVGAHENEAYRISRHSWCEGAKPIVQAGVYFCPPR